MERGEEHGTAESMIRDEGSHLPPLLLGDSTVLDRPLLFEKTEGDALVGRPHKREVTSLQGDTTHHNFSKGPKGVLQF